MKNRKLNIKMFQLIIMCFIFIAFLKCNVAEAALSYKTDNQTGNMGLFYSSESSTYSGNVIDIGSTNGVLSMREITFRVKRVGNYSSSIFTMYAVREAGSNANRPYSPRPTDDVNYQVLQTSFSDTAWHQYTVTVPDNGYDQIVLLDDEKYYSNSTRFQVEIQNVKYYDYSNTYTVTANYNMDTKKIDFYLVSNENLPSLDIYISGQSSKYIERTFTAGTTLIYSDASITTDKYYNYTTRYGFEAMTWWGTWLYAGTNPGPSFTIYTYSDAYYAKEAAEEARDAANSAVTAAQGAKASAENAVIKAQTAVNQTVDAGTSAASWAHQSYDKANQASLDATYIRMPQY